MLIRFNLTSVNESKIPEICELAKLNDIEGLTKLEQDFPECIAWNDPSKADFVSAVHLLATQGEDAAVQLLISQFKASRNDAIEGYARVKNHKQVEFYTQDLTEKPLKMARAFACQGYAYALDTERVNAYMEAGTAPRHALHGYACAGRPDLVFEFLEKYGYKDMDYALGGLIATHHEAEVARLIVLSRKQEIDAIDAAEQMKLIKFIRKIKLEKSNYKDCLTFALAMYWYVSYDYLFEEQLALRLIALTEDDKVRNKMIKYMQNCIHPVSLANSMKQHPNMAMKGLPIKEGLRLNSMFKRGYELSVEQAQKLTSKGLRVWLLQGQKQSLIKFAMPHDVFLLITAFLLELPVASVKKIYAEVCKNTYKGAMDIVRKKHKSEEALNSKYTTPEHRMSRL